MNLHTVAALLLTATIAAGIPAAAQRPTFSTKVEAVRVDVLVTEKGRALRDLGADDFQVFDNGVPQQVDLVSFEQLPLNVVLALDMSESVAGEPLEHLRAAGRALLGTLSKNDQVGLATFSHVVNLAARLTGDVRKVATALNRTRAGGETALIDGTFTGMILGESDVGRSLLIVFSDGLDTSSWLTADDVLDIARRSDVVVYGVSVGARPKKGFLYDLCSTTGGSLVEADSTKDVGAIFLRVLDEFRHRYLVSYSPRGVVREGWHRIDVRVRRPNTKVQARPGYSQ